MVTELEVKAALRAVHDPHVPVPIEEMGMLRGIEIADDGTVMVELGIPCLACPGVSMLKNDIVQAVSTIAGVTGVIVDEGWHHHWTTNMIAPEAREFMRRNGIRT
ncbi:metal-sulfur cluster assembly factor [Agrobacterium deltaense]|uniref:iron-sulfur cluster assembly protein n=1 Tax=Agrobacterium deltaense TaxID=1183412 RepID=UPI00028A41DB